MSDIISPKKSQRKPTPEFTNIYRLRDPETNEIRYIGKADDLEKRLEAHLWRNKKDHTYKGRWIKGLRAKGLKPIIELVEMVPYAIWPEREQY